MREIQEEIERLDNVKRKIEKQEKWNKKAIQMGKIALEKLIYESDVEMYHFYDYDNLLELLKDKLHIDIDYSLLYDIINELVDKDKEYWIKKTSGVYFQE